MDKKTKNTNKDLGFIYKIIECHPYITVSSTIKLAYLIDFLAVKQLNKTNI